MAGVVSCFLVSHSLSFRGVFYLFRSEEACRRGLVWQEQVKVLGVHLVILAHLKLNIHLILILIANKHINMT